MDATTLHITAHPPQRPWDRHPPTLNTRPSDIVGGGDVYRECSINQKVLGVVCVGARCVSESRCLPVTVLEFHFETFCCVHATEAAAAQSDSDRNNDKPRPKSGREPGTLSIEFCQRTVRSSGLCDHPPGYSRLPGEWLGAPQPTVLCCYEQWRWGLMRHI